MITQINAWKIKLN